MYEIRNFIHGIMNFQDLYDFMTDFHVVMG